MNEHEGQGPRRRRRSRALLIHNRVQLIDRHGGGQPWRQLRASGTGVFDMVEVVSAAVRRHGRSDISFLTEVDIALYGGPGNVFQTGEAPLYGTLIERIDRAWTRSR